MADLQIIAAATVQIVINFSAVLLVAAIYFIGSGKETK